MNLIVKNKAIELTRQTPNEEVCGLFYTNFNTINFYPCKNISISPTTNFEISLDDFFKVENLGDIVGIFHSHVNETSEFSNPDKSCAEENVLPIFCYSDFDGKFREFRPKSYKSNLYQRQFIRGQYDCFSVVRDHYWNTFEYLLDDFDRDDDFEKNNDSVVLKNYESQGLFFPENQTDIKEHDILLYKSMKYVYPHHLEVFVGNSRILKHLKNKLSGKEIIDGNLFSKKFRILRLKNPSVKRDISFC